MLIFDASKNKKIQMAIESSGIESDKLKFTFVIDTGKVQYGFPCMFNEGRVEVDIPPLEEIIKDLEPGTYTARLDVTGDNKYYLNPFNEAVEVKQAPAIKKLEIQSDDVSEEIKLAISSLVEVKEEPKEEPKIDEEVEEEPEPIKKSGIGAFFDKKK